MCLMVRIWLIHFFVLNYLGFLLGDYVFLWSSVKQKLSSNLNGYFSEGYILCN